MALKTNKTKLPSDRSFGLLFSGVSVAASAYGHYRGWTEHQVQTGLVAGGVLLLIALILPILLRPFNWIWYWIGQILNKIVSPVVLSVLFFGLITPIAVISRLFGRDPLRLKQRKTDSYWIDRSPTGSSTSFENQF